MEAGMPLGWGWSYPTSSRPRSRDRMQGLSGLRLVTLVVSLGLLLGRADAADRRILERIHYTSVREYTRVVITLSGETRHRLFTLPADPASRRSPRIVIDFSSAGLGARTPRTIPIHQGLLKQVRTGQFDPSTVRVVLDVERHDEHRAFALYAPYRLVIDIRGRQPQPAPLPDRQVERKKIMIDPGHGGKDPGALGRNHVKEKDVVLSLSKRLARKLEARLPVEVLFTRTDDTFIPLEERTARANAAGASLFVSVHANASHSSKARGIETYYLNNTNDRAARRLAAFENGLLHLANPVPAKTYVSNLVSVLLQNGKADPSIDLARHLQTAMVTQAKKRNPQVRNLGVKKGPFYVLVGADMPCVLVEAGFLTNSKERRLLLSPAYQNDLAEGMYQGIAKFLSQPDKNL